MNFKGFFLLLLSICYSLTTLAHNTTSGCLSSASGYIYTDDDGYYNSVPEYRFDSQNDRWLTVGQVYCVNYGQSNSCYINVPKNSDAYDDGFRSAYGIYVTYVWENCPIDDFVVFIIIGIGGIGFFSIKNKLAFS